MHDAHQNTRQVAHERDARHDYLTPVQRVMQEQIEIVESGVDDQGPADKNSAQVMYRMRVMQGVVCPKTPHHTKGAGFLD